MTVQEIYEHAKNSGYVHRYGVDLVHGLAPQCENEFERLLCASYGPAFIEKALQEGIKLGIAAAESKEALDSVLQSH